MIYKEVEVVLDSIIVEKVEGNFKYGNHTSNLYRAKIYPNVKLEFYNNQ